MSIRPEFRWWILTLVVVGVLLGISALALDRPNVVWEGTEAKCPHCRTHVAYFSTRCAHCMERYDWRPVPDDQGPVSRWSLSSAEARYVRERVEALGEGAAVARVARAFEIPPEAAAEYLEHVGRGRCGWCGGTGHDLDAAEEGEECPVCLGRRACIGCGGDRRVRVGDEAAHRALLTYKRGLTAVSPHVSVEVQREEVRELNRKFLQWHAGTQEAGQLVFWPAWQVGHQRGPVDPAVLNARSRVERLLRALDAEE